MLLVTLITIFSIIKTAVAVTVNSIDTNGTTVEVPDKIFTEEIELKQYLWHKYKDIIVEDIKNCTPSQDISSLYLDSSLVKRETEDQNQDWYIGDIKLTEYSSSVFDAMKNRLQNKLPKLTALIERYKFEDSGMWFLTVKDTNIYEGLD